MTADAEPTGLDRFLAALQEREAAIGRPVRPRFGDRDRGSPRLSRDGTVTLTTTERDTQ